MVPAWLAFKTTWILPIWYSFENLQSQTNLMRHVAFTGNFWVRTPPPPPLPPFAMLEAYGNVIDELTSMCSSSNQHCKLGGGSSAVEGSCLHAGKTSFNTKLICPNEFCPRLQFLNILDLCVTGKERSNKILQFSGSAFGHWFHAWRYAAFGIKIAKYEIRNKSIAITLL